ncbi:MAG: ABC transporter substrate-binding protein [Alphaproteobacteria bacterium]|nr:ABC transporter substrate-binding protein [Alphaproteobacteria bacterium]MBV9152944.1 ABC transporter substrate-binding protein [Alphaproteobacteria bacterium]
MRRRDFLVLAGGIAVVQPRSSLAQVPGNRPLIGYFAGGKRAIVADLVDAFQQGLRELALVEGDNVNIVYRFAEAHPERLPRLAKELVELNPTVILAGAVDTTVTLRNLTTTIPIVSPALADAIQLGLVSTMARPGGNVTGITPYIAGLPAKQLEIAREIVPGATVIGVLGNMGDPKAPPQLHELETAAPTVEAKIVAVDIHGEDELPTAVEQLIGEAVQVIIVLQTTMLLSLRKQIAAVLEAKRLPAVFGYQQHVLDGGLISYGVDLRWCFHRAATYIYKILNGARPGDLPVEFPTKIQMVVNLKTAQALGIAMPQSILARADEVIE